MVPEVGAWTGFVSKTPVGNHIVIDFAYEPLVSPNTQFRPPMNALYYKAAYSVTLRAISRVHTNDE